MKKLIRTLIVLFIITFAALTVWAIVGEEDNFARKILSLIGAVVFSFVGLTVSAVVDYLVVKGGGLPR